MKIWYHNFCDPQELIYDGDSVDDAKQQIHHAMTTQFHGISSEHIDHLIKELRFVPYERWVIECCMLRRWYDTPRPSNNKIEISNYLRHIVIEGADQIGA